MRMRLGFLLLASALNMSVQAHDFSAGSLHLIHPTTQPTTSKQDAVGVYLVIENAGSTPDRLVSASSDVSKQASLHVMNPASHGMPAMSGLAIPAKGRVALAEDGPHIMLTGMDRQLKAGERFPLRLQFEKAGAVQVDVLVAPNTAEAGQAHASH
jgi:copper(I)-binding protein